jgi:hypothetical protein
MPFLEVFATARDNETGEKKLFSALVQDKNVPDAVEQARKMIAREYTKFSVILPKYIEYPFSMTYDGACPRPERKDTYRYRVKTRNPIGGRLLSEFYVWATSANEAEDYVRSLPGYSGHVIEAEKCDVFD